MAKKKDSIEPLWKEWVTCC